MDNLVESFNRQTANAQRLRSKHEQEAIALMKQMGLTKTQIQISGGVTLQLMTDHPAIQVDISLVEKELQQAGVPVSKVQTIMNRLKAANPPPQDHLKKRQTT